MTKQIDQFTVNADRNTGEWLGEPKFVASVQRIEWNAKQDTDAAHFDTYEQAGVTRAIEVIWVE